MRVVPFSLLLALVGCATENEIQKQEVEPSFDEGDTAAPPVDTDSDTDEPLEEDSGVIVYPEYCDDRYVGPEAVEQDALCDGGPTNPDWTLEVLWEVNAGSATYSPLVVGQLDDDDGDGDVDADDYPDIIAIDSSANLYSINGRDGTTNWTRSIVNTTNLLSAIADVNADGWPDVLTDINYTVTAIDGRTGTTIWTGPSSSGKNKGSCGAVGVNDLDGDGMPEVYVGGKIMDGATGTQRGNGAEGDGFGVGNSYGHSVAADLDGDGVREIVVGNAAYDADGTTIWANGGTDGTVAVADLDLDGSPEIVSVGNYGLTTMDFEGGTLWTYDLAGASASTPVIADLDGDGDPEIVIPTTTSILAIDGEGELLWTVAATGSGSGRGGASAYDLDGNGAWEVIWASPTATTILDGTTGTTLSSYASTNTTCAGPVPVVDLDGDDHAEIVVIDASGKIRALRDTSGFTDARPVWHQSDYSLTNIEDDSAVPMDPVPNWQGENNFRAGERVTTVESVYPLIREVCTVECDRGDLWVWYSLANNGYYDVAESFQLDIWGQSDGGMVYLGSADWSGTVEAGRMTEGQMLELSGVPAGVHDLQIHLVGVRDPEFVDCSEDDNRQSWGGEVCPS